MKAKENCIPLANRSITISITTVSSSLMMVLSSCWFRQGSSYGGVVSTLDNQGQVSRANVTLGSQEGSLVSKRFLVKRDPDRKPYM